MPAVITKKRTTPSSRRTARAKWRLRRSAGLQVLESPGLSRLRWLIHGFSTRPGGAGVLKAPASRRGGSVQEKVLNLAFTDWDTRGRVLENRTKFFGALGAGQMRVVALRQIHSDIIHRVDSDHSRPDAEPRQGDALITREPGVLLVVQTADCIPILLADTKRRAIAAIHAGWRGTGRRIAAKALGRMQMEFGTRPEDIIAAFGPGIGQCCYEVGPDVVKEFNAQFPQAREWFEGPFDALASGEDPNPLPWLTMRPPGHPAPAARLHLDLIAANRAILAAAGVPAASISSSGFCTSCRTGLFFSFRRERTTGRMMAGIGIR